MIAFSDRYHIIFKHLLKENRKKQKSSEESFSDNDHLDKSLIGLMSCKNGIVKYISNDKIILRAHLSITVCFFNFFFQTKSVYLYICSQFLTPTWSWVFQAWKICSNHFFKWKKIPTIIQKNSSKMHVQNSTLTSIYPFST